MSNDARNDVTEVIENIRHEAPTNSQQEVKRNDVCHEVDIYFNDVSTHSTRLKSG